MSDEVIQRKLSFGVRWVLLNTLCWGILYVMAVAAGWLVWKIYQGSDYSIWSSLLRDGLVRQFIAIIIFGFCGGIIIGSLQQLLLNRYIKINKIYWAIATTVGIILNMVILYGFYPAFISSHYHISPIVKYVYYLSCGLLLGLAQWFILRQNFQRSGWWILATTVSSLLSASITEFLFSQIHINYPMEVSTNIFVSFIILFLEGFCYGVATWLVLIKLAKKPGISADENTQLQPVQ
jgi:hypothetical protein